MDNKKTLVLLDGYNTMFRVAWAFRNMTNEGEPTGVIFGFMKQLLSVWNRWYDAHVVIAWESKSRRRLVESQQAITDGIIPIEYGVYKANRVKREGEEIDEVREAVMLQKETLFEVLSHTLAQQVRVDDYEADDVIGSFAKRYDRPDTQVFVVSSDKDFYQLLSDNVTIYDAMKEETWTAERFTGEYGITPKQWVDVGALQGDSGDNILGVYGIGVKTAIKIIEEFKDIDGVFIDMPKKEKLSKKERGVLDAERLVRVAYSLKKIDTDITEGIEVRQNCSDAVTLRRRFEQLGFKSLFEKVGVFTRRSTPVSFLEEKTS